MVIHPKNPYNGHVNRIEWIKWIDYHGLIWTIQPHADNCAYDAVFVDTAHVLNIS